MTRKGSQNNSSNDSSEPRRRLLKTVAASGTALGLTALPGKWAKPVVASVVLPAHAQSSPATGPCCNLEVVERSVESFDGNLALSIFTETLTGISQVGTTLEGSNEQSVPIVPDFNCPPGCDEEAAKYLTELISFGDGAYYRRAELQFLCGDEVVGLFYTERNGTRVGGDSTYGQYVGGYTFGAQACDEFEDFPSSPARQRFQFGR